MTSQYPKVNVKQEYCDDDSHYSSHNFWDYELAFNDYQEDASTQTDSFTVFKSILSAPYNEGVPDIPVTKLETHCFHSPPLRRTNHCYKNKSPNTVKVLMEKHRVNERLRHHCLNEQLYMICRIVPGFTDEGKETKVVMMQRIISYIAYLENSIRHLSKKMNIQPDPASQFLTHGVKDMDWSSLWCREHPTVNSEDSRDSQVSTLSMSRRLKLSSPTIDSTTDLASQESLDVSSSSVPTSQADSSQMSDISIKAEAYDRGDNARDGTHVDWLQYGQEKIEVFTQHGDQFDSLFGNSSFDQSTFQVPTSSFEEGGIELETSEVEWLGSPDKSIKVGKIENFGIKLDPDLNEEPVYEFSRADIVSPDQVLQQTSVKTSVKRKRIDSTDMFDSQELSSSDLYGSYFSSQENSIASDTILPHENVKAEIDCSEYQVVPCCFSKRKQLTPRRHPLSDMMNIPASASASELDTVYPVEDSTGIPMASNFMEVESSKEGTDHWKEKEEESPKEALQRIRSKVLEEASQLATTSKLDLRKSSWLNGFMMYSQVHRRRFIRENPGVHTAQISKMMGQTWRDMSQEQQLLYRDHAKLCSQELQQVLDRKIAELNEHRS